MHWGRSLGRISTEDLEQLGRSLERPVEHGGLDVVAPLTLVTLHSSGSMARPGLEGHRPGGRHWAPVFALRDVTLTSASLTTISRDDVAELEVQTTLTVRQGVLVVSATLVNRGTTRYLLTTFGVTLPIDQSARDVLSLSGRWARESHLQSMPFVGSQVFETRSGRSSHERQPSLWFARSGVSHQRGDVWTTHLAHSGNHSLWAQHLPDGRRCVQLGELLHPGEICLEPGEQYATPEVIAAYSSEGLSGTAANLHRFVRASRPMRSPRKVMLNTWESVYFNHDQEVLFDLARRGARVGAERFVLDDGWFGSRRNDRSGLGDWVVSRDVYPQGLTPLIEHVESLGMDFGIWVEPECVNEDSDVFRKHPEWALVDRDREPIRGRNQLVLNLAIPDAFDHILGQLDALLSNNRIAYVKWDMNRAHVAGSGLDGAAGTHAQTLAMYRLIDELRTRHPRVEFESCASGGGRVDLGMIRRVDRVWASDTIDALERQEILRGLSLTLPLEFIGSHIGSRVAHTTGRRHSIAFRGLTALFGHLGIEWNLVDASEEELETLSEIVALYKRSRELLHSGTFVYCDLAQPLVDPSALAYGVIASDRAEALFVYAQLRSEQHQTPDVMRIAGLDPDAHYRVSVVDVAGGVRGMARRQPEWVTSSVTMRGIDLEVFGLQPPAIVPESAVLFSLSRQ
jgi:alpha-galactosidase